MVGLGYSSVSSNLQMNGTYIIEDAYDPQLSFSVTDPININYTDNSFRATGGIKLKFGPVTLHVDYTWQAYHIVSAGLGFSIR